MKKDLQLRAGALKETCGKHVPWDVDIDAFYDIWYSEIYKYEPLDYY